MRGALWLSEMGDCTRRKVGALIVGPDKRFWGMGYNGSYPGGPSCLAGDCLRGRHYRRSDEDTGGYASYDCTCELDGSKTMFCSGRGHPGVYSGGLCACGKAWPCPDAVEPGSAYDTGPGMCAASHAESNAISDAQQRNGGRLKGCVMYVSCEPCEGCLRHIRNQTDIKTVIWPDGVTAFPFERDLP